MSRYYIDCEFDGHGGPIISMALVREDGRSIHIGTTAEAKDPWVAANVVPIMGRHQATLNWRVAVHDVGVVIREFLGEDNAPIIVADSPVDIGRFCTALTTSPAGGWASAEYPVMMFEVRNVDCYPTTLPGAVQHNAWWDAMALRHKLASVGTLPEGGDAKRAPCASKGDAVPLAADAQTPSEGSAK